MPKKPVNRRQKAIALRYDADKQSAPRLIAKGQGKVAERILESAAKNGIPLHKDPELIEILSKLDVGKEVPPDLYQAVAQILIYIYRMNQRRMGEVRQATSRQAAKQPAASIP